MIIGELLISLHLSSKTWNSMLVPSYSVYAVLETESRALCMLGNHVTTWAASPDLWHFIAAYKETQKTKSFGHWQRNNLHPPHFLEVWGWNLEFYFLITQLTLLGSAFSLQLREDPPGVPHWHKHMHAWKMLPWITKSTPTKEEILGTSC